MMDICRICLNKRAQKDILLLQVVKGNEKKTFIDIMMFCLEIQAFKKRHLKVGQTVYLEMMKECNKSTDKNKQYNSKVEQDSKISTKLCLKCYKKLLDFNKFKSLAIKNDTYLRSLDVKNEIFIREDEIEIKTEEESNISMMFEDDIIHEDPVKDELDSEICLKTEDVAIDESEDEFLSVVKKIKYEYVEDEVKENAPVKKRKKKHSKEISTTINKQMCEECGKTVNDLKAHSYLHLPLEQRKRIKCKVCDKVFSSHSARYRHNKIKHLGIKEMCNICSKKVSNLKQHTLSMHNKELLKYECPHCERRFIYQSLLELHVRVHTKDRPFACELCDKKFANRNLARQHKRSVHDKEKTHLCQLCSKSFFKKYHLQLHLKTHSNEKEYECPDCGKFYKTPGVLKSHRQLHGEVKNFSCHLCNQTFMKRIYLSAHMLSHTKEKRFPCQYCGVKFHRSDHRKRHEFTAHQKHLISSTTST